MSSSVSEALANLPGLRNAKAAILSIVGANSGAQAVILYGAQSAGQMEAARVLCQGWLCTSNDPKPCGTCPSCRAFEVGRAVDLLSIEPFGPSRTYKLECIKPSKKSDSKKPDKEKDYTGVPVREFIRTRPLMSPNKVVFMTEAERIPSNTASALLKTLEELPPFIRFVFSTSSLNRIPTTLRSRCLLIGCDSPPPEDWPEDFGKDTLLTAFARTPGEALRVNRARGAYERLKLLLKVAQTAPVYQALKLAEEFRDIMDAVAEALKIDKRPAQLETLQSASQWFLTHHPESIHWIKAIAEAHRHVNGYGNAKIATDALFIQGVSGRFTVDEF